MRPAAPGSLRYSALAGAAELGAAPLKQSSPFFRQHLRCLARHMGTQKASRLNQQPGKWAVAVDHEKMAKMGNAA